jgi:hypothetical protein
MKMHRLLLNSWMVLTAMMFLSCTKGQVAQVLQNQTQDMISGPCPPGNGPVSAAPEFCLYVTDLQVVNRDTEVDVSLSITNRTGRRIFLSLSTPPALTDGTGTRWDYKKGAGIYFRSPSQVPISVEPNVETQASMVFQRYGQSQSDLTFTMRGDIGVMKVDSRGQAHPIQVEVNRGFNLSGLHQTQQQLPLEPMKQKSQAVPSKPESQSLQPALQGIQASARSSVSASYRKVWIRMESAPLITRRGETFIITNSNR